MQRLARMLTSRGLSLRPRASLPDAIAAILAIATTAIAVACGAFVAGGSDEYGYVSQASLWAERRLRIAQPVVLDLPSSITDEVASPLGYRPARRLGLPGGIVPTYAPGLPMQMAIFHRVGGPDAVFYVVPLLAGLAVWLTYLLGRRLGGAGTGLLAALMLATSPAFLAHACVPMSDVPVTAWWLAALLLAARPSSASAAGAGAAAGVAILTRPNLLPLGAVIGLGLVAAAFGSHREPKACRRVLLFGAVAAVACLALAQINQYLYRSPVESGYGPLVHYFDREHIPVNAARYSAWLLETQTPLVLLFIPGALVAVRAAGAPAGAGWSRRRLTWVSLALIGTTMGSYLAFLPFESWAYLRFLLPAYPLMFGLCGVALTAMIDRAPVRARALLLVVTCVAVSGIGWREVDARGVLAVTRGEDRYPRIAEQAAPLLPPQAIVFSMHHSGSFRYYTGHMTLRYDLLRPDSLDETIETLLARGYRPYILLDLWEEEVFRQRFQDVSRLGRLDWPPLVEIRHPGPVRLYDAAEGWRRTRR
jgi:hypothetical protein